MLDRQNLVDLMKQVAKADPSAPVAYSYNDENLSYEALNETLRQELNGLAGTYALYRENKNTIFSIMEEVLNDVLPKKVIDQYKEFAEVKIFNQGDKPIFRRKINARNRAKQFITRVGLAGVYETFKLDPATESFEVPTSAMGGAAQLGLEEFLDGRVDFAELLQVILEGMDDLIYREVAKAMQDAVNQLPGNNQIAGLGFDEAGMDKAVMIASAYGTPTIFCTREFAVKMIPNEAWRYSDGMKETLWNQGHFTDYKGTRVVILDNGFEDETNSRKVINPGYVWIIPTGVDNKPVKIAFEGDTIVDESVHADRAREIQVYKKVGIVAMMNNGIVSYKDSSLVDQMTTWNFGGTVNNTVTVDGTVTVNTAEDTALATSTTITNPASSSGVTTG